MQPATPWVRWLQILHPVFKRNFTRRCVRNPQLPCTLYKEDAHLKTLCFIFQVIAALLQTMEDQGNQRVQAHAAAALINFTEDCPKSLLIPYLDNLVKHLHSIMVLKLQEVRFKISEPRHVPCDGLDG